MADHPGVAAAGLGHLRDGLEVGLTFHPELPEAEQIAILCVTFLLGALAFGWASAIRLAFAHSAAFPRLYGLMVLAEILSVPVMIAVILIYPFMAFGGLLLFAGVHVALGTIFVPYMRVSKRVKATFPGQAAP